MSTIEPGSELTIKFEDDEDGDSIIRIYKNNKEVFRWNDWANLAYPEDLIWSRMISDVFWEGYNLGRKSK